MLKMYKKFFFSFPTSGRYGGRRSSRRQSYFRHFWTTCSRPSRGPGHRECQPCRRPVLCPAPLCSGAAAAAAAGCCCDPRRDPFVRPTGCCCCSCHHHHHRIANGHLERIRCRRSQSGGGGPSSRPNHRHHHRLLACCSLPNGA